VVVRNEMQPGEPKILHAGEWVEVDPDQPLAQRKPDYGIPQKVCAGPQGADGPAPDAQPLQASGCQPERALAGLRRIRMKRR